MFSKPSEQKVSQEETLEKIVHQMSTINSESTNPDLFFSKLTLFTFKGLQKFWGKINSFIDFFSVLILI